MNIKPLVSVISLTFNQEKYIKDCIEGILAQQTDFPIEVLVFDDASTDHTSDILRLYAKNYPTIIKPTIYSENNFSRGLGFVGLYEGFEKAQGKYIAICEGDDFWTDPNKLQRQVNYMESHPDCYFTFHRSSTKWEGKGDCPYNYETQKVCDRDYTSSELLEEWIVPFASVLFRTEITKYPIKNRKAFFSGDDILYYQAAEYGKIHGMSAEMSVYRIYQKSISRNDQQMIHRLKVYPEHYINIYLNFPSIDRKKLRHRIAVQIYHRMNVTSSLWERTKDWFRMARWDFPYAWNYLSDRLKWYWIYPVKRGIMKKFTWNK